MKPKSKQLNNSLKLPQIGNRTMEKFDNDVKEKGKQRPNSSKNILVDLEKKLFSQLNSFEQNPALKSKTLRSKKHIQGGKDTKFEQADIGMHKIAQLMPELYSKIIQCKKYDNVESQQQYSHTLKQKNMSNLKQFNLAEDLTLDFNEFKKEKVPQISLKNENKANQVTSKKLIKKQKPIPQQRSMTMTSTSTSNTTLTLNTTSTTSPSLNVNGITSNINRTKIQKEAQESQVMDPSYFFQGQQQEIYQSYLKNEGLSKETSMHELRKINQDLKSQQVDIEQLQASYSNLIRTLGHLCIEESN